MRHDRFIDENYIVSSLYIKIILGIFWYIFSENHHIIYYEKKKKIKHGGIYGKRN